MFIKKKIKEFVNSNIDKGGFEIMLRKKSTSVKRYQHMIHPIMDVAITKLCF